MQGGEVIILGPDVTNGAATMDMFFLLQIHKDDVTLHTQEVERQRLSWGSLLPISGPLG